MLRKDNIEKSSKRSYYFYILQATRILETHLVLWSLGSSHKEEKQALEGVLVGENNFDKEERESLSTDHDGHGNTILHHKI